jgi:DNA-binding NarL/FixJ family response regulator
MRILVADDSVLVRSGIAEILSDRAWEICGEASDGTEALEKARRLKPDLVLLDVSMPGTNGLVVAELIRKELPAVRIVMVSLHALDQLLDKAHWHLADGLVDKSRLGMDLIPTINKLFQDDRTSS